MELLPEQIKFIESKKPIVVFSGGIGSGKTVVASVKAIMNALNGRRELMVGLTYSTCRDVILDTIFKVLEFMNIEEHIHYEVNKANMEILFNGGGSILLKSAELKKKLRGLSVDDIFVDEAGYTDEELYDILLGRMRESEDGQIFLTSSPAGFNWFYDVSMSSESEYIKVSTFKNSFLPKQYLKNMLKQYSTAFIRQELYADFVQLSSGLFDGEWIKTTNGTDIKGFEDRKKILFFDFAFSTGKHADYTAGVLLSSIDGKYIIEDIVRVKQEYTDLRKTIVSTAQRVGKDVMLGFEQAGQQKAIISDLNSIPQLSMFNKRALKISKYGSKIKRMLPLASLAENGNLYIMDKCKNKKEFRDECNALTMDDSHTHDDMIDACASAFIMFSDTYNSARAYKSNIY